MKRLPDNLRKSGFNYTKILREGSICIYEQDYSENIRNYEIFIVKTAPDRGFKGVFFEAH